ncbi:MAG: dihydropyrimidinase [Sulfitobacter sp.]|nr:dihydropyrimidinase [Sulfitobacter sp.]
MTYDLKISGGTLATAAEVFQADLAISEGRIAAVGQNLGPAGRTIDATDRLVLPGGVDSHCHIEQLSGAGLMNADTFESAHRSAAFGGTTTTISFAAQHPGMRLGRVMEDYAALARKGALVDHAFHSIVADTSGENLTHDLPALIESNHRSIKIFTTYDKVRLADAEILATLDVARAKGAMVCFHAENDAMIRWATARLLAAGKTAPRYHAESHPREAEIEALSRICHFAELTGQPVILFHISTEEGVDIVRTARARGVPVFAETCPHYLFMTEEILNKPGNEGAAFLCSPPQRRTSDQEALWQGLADRTLDLVSSDHAPYRMDETGKFANGPSAPFNKMANGMPGLETRLPLLFDAMVTKGRMNLRDFVRLTATASAAVFGLTGKGTLDEGADADITIWNPTRSHTYGVDDLYDNVGYNPFAGRTVTGWPETVLSRGEVIVEDGRLHAQPGRGHRIEMGESQAMTSAQPRVPRP